MMHVLLRSAPVLRGLLAGACMLVAGLKVATYVEGRPGITDWMWLAVGIEIALGTCILMISRGSLIFVGIAALAAGAIVWHVWNPGRNCGCLGRWQGARAEIAVAATIGLLAASAAWLESAVMARSRSK